MKNPYDVGDQVAHLGLDAEGLRVERATVRETRGMEVAVSPSDDRAAQAVEWVTVNEFGEAADLVPLDQELEDLIGLATWASIAFNSEIGPAEKVELDQYFSHEERKEQVEEQRLLNERGYGYGR